MAVVSSADAALAWEIFNVIKKKFELCANERGHFIINHFSLISFLSWRMFF